METTPDAGRPPYPVSMSLGSRPNPQHWAAIWVNQFVKEQSSGQGFAYQ